MATGHGVKEAIRRAAMDLGFDECHFASAAPALTGSHYIRWLAAGCHGEMGYLARQPERRLDPGEVLPGVRSVVAVAVSYHRAGAFGFVGGSEGAGGAASCSDPPGRIARYARAADYHDALAPALGQLAAIIDGLGGQGTRSRGFVDTAPILEREYGGRAGLGFVGKHTNLISRRLGNWILLAEILTTLEIEPDRSERNRCGSCTRCIEACPTGAITAPYRLDARLCISYLTIELKGPIPEPLRPAMGNRVFGCDDCLEVCPWNRFAREGRLMRGVARPDLDQVGLVELLRLDEAGFRARFRDTPLWRGGRRRLLRNVCVALGNVGDGTVLGALERAARDPEPPIAGHAEWAIRRI
jgi:epoxyqueuosine reductase